MGVTLRGKVVAQLPEPEPESIPMSSFTKSRYQRLSDASGTSSGSSQSPLALDSPDTYHDYDFPMAFEDVDKQEVTVTTRLLGSSRGKQTELGVPGTERRFFFQRSKENHDPDAVATQPSVFDDPDTLEEYMPNDEWENFHRFDPDERWTWREENRVVRKIDSKIMAFAAFMFMALELDRSNISQALSDNFLADLGMTTNGGCFFK